MVINQRKQTIFLTVLFFGELIDNCIKTAKSRKKPLIA